MKEGNVEGQGQQTLARQPSFRANLGTNVTNIDQDGLNYDLVFDNEVFDIGSNYDITNGRFTAPVDGVYFAYCELWLLDLDVDATTYHFAIRHKNSGGTQQNAAYCSERLLATVDCRYQIAMTGMFEMNATDYLICTRNQSGGVSQTDIDNGQSFFQGFLIG